MTIGMMVVEITSIILSAMDQAFTPHELDMFTRDGFIIRPHFFSEALMAPLRDELQWWSRQSPPPDAYTLPIHGNLIAHEPLMHRMEQLCGPKFRFHHLNTYYQTAGDTGVPWHNDYEQVALPMPRTHANIIVLFYPGGLNGEVGDLVVVPGTQRRIAAWDAYGFLGTAVLPGEVVIDRLPPGSAVFCHTGLVHCRRPQVGAGPRYFTDLSYVASGVRWPATCQYDWRAMYRFCREHAYDQGGRYAHLFEDDDFFDWHAAQAQMAGLRQTDIYDRLKA